jgi:hypothetical protein
MADALDLGSSGVSPCRFNSCYPHHQAELGRDSRSGLSFIFLLLLQYCEKTFNAMVFNASKGIQDRSKILGR